MGGFFSIFKCTACAESRDEVDGPYVHYITDDALKGTPEELQQQLKAKVDNCTRNASADYIGICSGNDREKAMKRRYDSYKKENDINKMVAIYESDNQEDCCKVEKMLVNHRGAGTGTNINRVGGGGGRKSRGPKFQVYIALSE